MASGGTIDEILPLRENRDPQNDIALYKERTPPLPRNFLGKFKRPFIETADLMRNEVENAVEKAAKPIEDHESLTPNSLEKLEQFVMNAVNSDKENVIAKAAKAIEVYDK